MRNFLPVLLGPAIAGVALNFAIEAGLKRSAAALPAPAASPAGATASGSSAAANTPAARRAAAAARRAQIQGSLKSLPTPLACCGMLYVVSVQSAAASEALASEGWTLYAVIAGMYAAAYSCGYYISKVRVT